MKARKLAPQTVVSGTSSSAQPGAPGGRLPLAGTVFCFTGEMDALPRQDAEDRVKAAGGKVGSAVSSNTTYLVVGSRLEDGRGVEETSKYRKYLELKGKARKHPELLSEVQLLAILPAVGGGGPAPAAAPGTAPAIAAPRPAPAPSAGTSMERANWVDSYAPRSLGDLVGNSPVVRKLAEWLRDWEDVVLKGHAKKVPFKPGGGIPDNVNARAALVSGPPGVGKTTACRLIAQLHGSYEVLEYNASDVRGQKVIQEMADGIADNTTISFSGAGLGASAARLTRRACIIMDEVDGMGAGDRGGNAALIKMIKKTRNPIICICNDQHSQKVRSLASSCYDLKFTRPPKGDMAQRCAEIAKREGLDAEPNALEALAESCGGDLRMVLNQLQVLSSTPEYRGAGVRYMDMKARIGQMTKDQQVMLTPFDACKKLLNSSESARLTFRDRMDMFFIDFSLVNMLVQENYLRAVERRAPDVELLNRCAFSADLMTVGDIMNAKINTNQEWSLLPDMGLTSTAYPAFVTNGFVPYPGFPTFLGKYSTAARARRLAMELQTHLRLSGTVGGRELITSGYGDLLYRRLVNPLVQGNPEAVCETVGVLDAYGLRKDHLVEHLTELRQHLGQEDLFRRVDPRVKAAVTRELNSGGHAMKVVLPSGSKRRRSAADLEGGLGEDEEATGTNGAAGDQEDAESDDGAPSALVKVKGRAAAAKAKGKAKAEPAAAGAPKAKAKGRAKGKARA